MQYRCLPHEMSVWTISASRIIDRITEEKVCVSDRIDRLDEDHRSN